MGICFSSAAKAVGNSKEFDRNNLVNMTKEAFKSGSKTEALKYILSVKSGREAFMKFLKSEYADENLRFFQVNINIFF